MTDLRCFVVTISLNRLVLLGSVRMCRALLILVLNLPVISTACTLFYRMYQLVEDVVSGASNDIGSEKAAVLMSTDTAPHQSPEQRPVLGNYIDDPSCAWDMPYYGSALMLIRTACCLYSDRRGAGIPREGVHGAAQYQPENTARDAFPDPA